LYRLDCGPYALVVVLDEKADPKPLVIQGLLLDIYDSKLPVLQAKSVAPNQRAFLYRLPPATTTQAPKVLAAAAPTYKVNM
jgi:hypothetical protein